METTSWVAIAGGVLAIVGINWWFRIGRRGGAPAEETR